MKAKKSVKDVIVIEQPCKQKKKKKIYHTIE